jgi:hypothetical protein
VNGTAVPTILDRFGPLREPHDAVRNSLREFLYPQIGRPLCRVFALAADTRPERVIAADLLHEELGASGVYLVAEASDPIRMQSRGRCRRKSRL